jgi:hypothetical protein
MCEQRIAFLARKILPLTFERKTAMRISMTNRMLCVPIFVLAISVAQASFGELLLNYQFETVNGTAPTQTTIDSSGKHAEALNEVLGPGTTPGTDYPQQITGTGIVANSLVKSLNPNAYMNFTGPNVANSNSSRVGILDGASGGGSGPLDTQFTQFTFAAWVKPTFVPEDFDSDRLIAGKAGGGTAGSNRGWQISSPSLEPGVIGDVSLPGHVLVDGGDDLLITYYASASGTPRELVVHNVLPLDTWTHIAFTFDGAAGTEAVYINGALATIVANTSTSLATVPATLNGANAGAFMAGARAGTASGDGSRTGGIYGWYGGLDDVRIYDEALAFTPIGSATGIGSLLTAVPEPSGLVMAIMGIGILRYRRRYTTKVAKD